MHNRSPLAPKSDPVKCSPIDIDGGVAPVSVAKGARLAELRTCLTQIKADSTASFIGKVAYRARQLGVSQVATMLLLKDYFTGLGCDDLRPLRIARFVKGCYRWSRDHEETQYDLQ
jgi:hypothetical protein